MTVEKITADAAYASSGLLALTGLTLQDAIGLIGVLLAVATFAVNWHYRARADRRAEAEHQQRMADAGGGEGPSGIS